MHRGNEYNASKSIINRYNGDVVALGLAAICFLAPRQAAGEKYALLIGIDQYDSKSFNKLNGAANDANDLAKALIRFGGYKPENVIVLTSNREEASLPTFEHIRDARSTLCLKASKPEDTIFMFVAGHGLTLGESAVFPAKDAQIPVKGREDDVVSNPTAYKYMDTAFFMSLDSLQARTIVAAFDMCRNEPYASETVTTNSRNVMNGLLANTLTSPKVVRATATNATAGSTTELKSAIWLACSIGKSSYEMPDRPRGVFSFQFEQALQKGDTNKDGTVTVDEVRTYLESKVPAQTKGEQTPDCRMVGFKMGSVVVAYVPRAVPMSPTEPEVVIPNFKPEPSKVIQSEARKTGKIRQTVSAYEGVYSIAPAGQGYSITSGEGGFSIRIPQTMTNDPVRRKPEQITTPDGPTKLIGYGGHENTNYDFSTYGAYFMDYPSTTKKEKDILKWAETWLKDKRNTSIFQRELVTVLQDTLGRQKDIFKVVGKDVLKKLPGNLGGIFGGGKKRPTAVFEQEAYDIAGYPGRRLTWSLVPLAGKAGEVGSHGFVMVLMAVVGNRIFFLQEGYALHKESPGAATNGLNIRSFTRSFDFIE